MLRGGEAAPGRGGPTRMTGGRVFRSGGLAECAFDKPAQDGRSAPSAGRAASDGVGEGLENTRVAKHIQNAQTCRKHSSARLKVP